MNKNDDYYGIIYKIHNIKNNKVYIGQTTRKTGFKGRYEAQGEGIERLFNSFERKLRYGENINNYLYSSIKKNGFDSFSVNEEFDFAFNKEELDTKEKYWIKYYRSSEKEFGYNQTIGGDGFYYGKTAFKMKLGKTRKPIICLNTGDIFLTARDAEKKTGIVDTIIRNICNGKIKSGLSFSKVYNKKLSFKYIEKDIPNIQKPVICINTGKTYVSAKEAAVDVGMTDPYRITKNCIGMANSAGRCNESNKKLVWAFALDYLIENEINLK
ncbi:hypothetical protein P4V41_07260 [Fictibacillus nanhaiensis]|uniref:hypothetical protein n=1 Tax=Fictibacillus nanhaiensis TaxID=742169 RepID=UPI002E1AB639|nr:hypothetical protein [Fictibacillus nanhaiensis]